MAKQTHRWSALPSGETNPNERAERCGLTSAKFTIMKNVIKSIRQAPFDMLDAPYACHHPGQVGDKSMPHSTGALPSAEAVASSPPLQRYRCNWRQTSTIVDFRVHVPPPEDMSAFTAIGFHRDIGAVRTIEPPTTIENALEAAMIGGVDMNVIFTVTTAVRRVAVSPDCFGLAFQRGRFP